MDNFRAPRIGAWPLRAVMTIALICLVVGFVGLSAVLWKNLFRASDPVQPGEYMAAHEACLPYRGVVSMRVLRGNGPTRIIVQCTSGVVIEGPLTTPAPAPTTYRS